MRKRQTISHSPAPAQLADQLFEALVEAPIRFRITSCDTLERDMTGHDIRELLRRGLTATNETIGLFWAYLA